MFQGISRGLALALLSGEFEKMFNLNSVRKQTDFEVALQ